MKNLLCMSLALMIVVLSACSETPANNYSIENDRETKAEYIIGTPTYRPFESARELTEMAGTVVIGKISGISFEVFNAETGLPPTEKTEEHNRWLYTIYDIDIITSYKGEMVHKVQMMMNGGIKDYRVEEQLSLIEKMGVWTGGGIPLEEYMPEIEIGETYLFTLNQLERGVFASLIPQQSIYNLNDLFKKKSINYELGVEYYSRSTDEHGNTIISAKDIISTFGKDKWEAFWADWQRSNPDWESRLDVAAVERALAE
ncbi:MAG: hypothetical protein FWH07_08450 [Oscillospiraceae bacterium]|nr:hypothetical protein [Oscillospiraceae bacterium]